MPISADFAADFTTFTTAVAVAQTKLVSFDDDAKKVANSLSAMEKSVSGVAIQQAATIAAEAVERLGGASKLTYAELQRLGATAQEAVDKMNALGQTVPAGVQDLADRARGAAEEMLRLKDNTDSVGNSFSQWAGKLDVKGALTDPVGTAKEGVIALAETMGPSGVLVTGLVATGGALIALGNQSQQVGQSIGRLSTQFNIPVEAVSNLRFAIKAAGGDFTTFGDSMFMFQKRIEDNADAVGKGLEKIGLSLADVRAMRPDEQFLAVSDALRSAGTETTKAAVAFEIFGRQGREMLPLLLKPLEDLTGESQKLGATWSKDDVDAARAFGKEQNLLAAKTDAAWEALGRDVAPVTNFIVNAYDRMKLAAANVAKAPFEGWADMFHILTGAMGENALADERVNAVLDASTRLYQQAAAQGLNFADQTKQVATQMLELGYTQENIVRVTGLSAAAVRALAGDLKTATIAAEAYNAAWAHLTELEAQGVPSLQNVSQATRDYIVHLQQLGATAKEIETATGVSIAQQKLIAEGFRDSEAAAKKYDAAWAELNSMGASWKETIAGINPRLAEQATYYLSIGAAQSTVVTATRLSVEEVKALDAAWKDHNATLKEVAKIETDTRAKQAEGILGLSKVEQEASQKRIQAESAGLDQIAKAEASLRDMQMKASLDKTSYQVMKIWEAADAQVKAFKGTSDQVAAFTKVVMDAAALQAQAVMDAADKALTKVTEKAVGAARAVQLAIQQVQAGLAVDVVANAQAAGVTGVGMQAPIYVSPPIYARAAGGPVSMDQPVLVGERGPELLVPSDSGVVVPNSGLGGGSGLRITINITQPLGTPDAIARVVGDALMTRMRQTGIRTP